MEAKFIVVIALITVGQSSVLPVTKVDNDYSSFAYDVADPSTGDYKSQVETRVGGNVLGQYSLLESDGTKRIVDYAADDINGFNAVVRKVPAVIGTSDAYGSIVKSIPAISSASVVSAVDPIKSSPYTVVAPSYFTSLVADRNLAYPGVNENFVPTEASTYLPVYSNPLKYITN